MLSHLNFQGLKFLAVSSTKQKNNQIIKCTYVLKKGANIDLMTWDHFQ